MRILVILPLFFGLCVQAQDARDCIFDQNTQTDEFIKDISEYSNYTWDDEMKEAIILLTNSDTLIARRGGCIHFGISGTLISSNLKSSFSDLDFWYNQARKIAVNIFHENDLAQMDKCFKEANYDNFSDASSVQIYFHHDSYDSFSLHVRKDSGRTRLSIGYYY